jgi:hypothetical protein
MPGYRDGAGGMVRSIPFLGGYLSTYTTFPAVRSTVTLTLHSTGSPNRMRTGLRLFSLSSSRLSFR